MTTEKARVEYKRKTDKLSKKEAKRIASKNKRMTDWVSRVATLSKSIPINKELKDLEIAPDMEWGDALDVTRHWDCLWPRRSQNPAGRSTRSRG